MFKMSAFSVDTGRQTTPPLVYGVVHNRFLQFATHGDQTLAQLVDVLLWYTRYKSCFVHIFWFRQCKNY